MGIDTERRWVETPRFPPSVVTPDQPEHHPTAATSNSVHFVSSDVRDAGPRLTESTSGGPATYALTT